MRGKASGWGMTMMALVAVAAACSPEGGELREATERRRLEQARLDSVGGDSAGAKEDGRLPAFVGDSAPAAPAPAAADTPPAEPRQPFTGQWTARNTEMERNGPVGIVRGVRVAQNQGFDRLVVDFGPGASIPGWKLEYVDRPVRQCGSGDATEVAGQGWLHLRLRTAQAHDDDGRATVANREMHLDNPIVREVEIVCDFEGDVEIVLGVSTPNPYRVLELQNPSRLVVDVQH